MQGRLWESVGWKKKAGWPLEASHSELRVLYRWAFRTVSSVQKTVFKSLCLKRRNLGAIGILHTQEWHFVERPSSTRMWYYWLIMRNLPSWRPAGNGLKPVARDQSERESFAPGLSLSDEIINSSALSHTSLVMWPMHNKITHASSVRC